MSTSTHSDPLPQNVERRHDFGAKEGAAARATYFKILFGGSFLTILLIFAIFSIFWGSLWKIPDHNLPGWVVDFDGGLVGQTVTAALTSTQNPSAITWNVISASQFPGGTDELAQAVHDEKTWVAIAINAGSTSRLNASLTSPDPTYNGSTALTFFGVEARNENAYRDIIIPSIQATLGGISMAFALQVAQQAANASNLSALLATSPQTIVSPVSYTIQNLAPFDIPVATAVTFVGLIYQTILSFFIVNIAATAREKSGLDKRLTTRSLIFLRLASSFTAYFVISLFYSLLSVAFQLTLDETYGHSGFLIFWMLNYVGMLATGLALESLITLLTRAFIPFFMLTLIIANVSVSTFPIEVLPHFFRYGYAAPFYNISMGMRSVIFGTKNRLGFVFGVLLIWVAISCITLPLFQVLVRRLSSRARSPNTLEDAVPEKSQS